MDSPFRPGFGKSPPYLAGREEALAQLQSGLEVGQWPQERAILMTGMRGVGKTVMLNRAEDLAFDAKWKVISETASVGFFERIVATHLPRLLNDLDPGPSFQVTQASAAGLGSITIQYPGGREETPTFRGMVTRVLELLEKQRGGGLLFSIDEVSQASADELAVFAGEYQHLVRADEEVAFIGAGVKGEIRDFLAHTSATFLRRCSPVEIGILSYEETEAAFKNPILGAGREVASETLDYLVRASQGYPFLVQSIGDIAWRNNPQEDPISLTDAQEGHRTALRTMGGSIHEPALAGLSRNDRSFLAAMAYDDGPSRIIDIRGRLGGADSGHTSVYRDRLLGTGLIEVAGYGRVTIAFPYLRSYLRNHVVAEAASDSRRADFPPPPPMPWS